MTDAGSSLSPINVNRLGLRINIPAQSQRAATVNAVAPLLASSGVASEGSSASSTTHTWNSSAPNTPHLHPHPPAPSNASIASTHRPSSAVSNKAMMVHTWSQELCLAWLNQSVLPLLVVPTSPTLAATPTAARHSQQSDNDLTLLDSVFNIAEMSYLNPATSPASATPVLTLRDLKKAGIKNGKDLLATNINTVKGLLPFISPNERTIVLDAIEELKLRVLEATGDIKLAFGGGRSGAHPSSQIPLPPQHNNSAAKSLDAENMKSAMKTSIDLSRLVVNRANANQQPPKNSAQLSDTQESSVAPTNKSFFMERNIFSNVMNPSASKIWEKCVKVNLLGLPERVISMIDISKSANGAVIRSKILSHKQFNLSAEAQQQMVIYAAQDGAGSYDAEHPLDDSQLYKIHKSTDINMRQLTLTARIRRSIQVYSSVPGESRILDVSMYFDGKSLRNMIYGQFVQGANDKSPFDLFRVTENGKVDTDHALNDAQILDIAKSSDLKSLKSLMMVIAPVGKSGSAKVLEKCIRVHTLSGESRSIDVSKCVNGQSIRDEVFRKFRYVGDQQKGFQIYGLNVTGRLDDGLDNDTLFNLSRSSDYNRRALLFLLKRAEFTEKGLDLDSAIALAIKRSPSQVLMNERNRSSLEGYSSDTSDGHSPSGANNTPPRSPSGMNFFSRRGWRQGSPTANRQQQPEQPQQVPALLRPTASNRMLPTPALQLRQTTSIDASSPWFKTDGAADTMSLLSKRTLGQRQSTSSSFAVSARRKGNRGTPSVLSNSSNITFPGERPALETIAQNLELFFPQMQPLDTSDAVQGVLWYNEEDVFSTAAAGFSALDKLDEDEEDDEPLLTRVSSIRKADIATSIYNGQTGSGSGGRSLHRANSNLHGAGTPYLDSRLSHRTLGAPIGRSNGDIFPPSVAAISLQEFSDPWRPSISAPSVAQRIPASPTASITAPTPTTKKVGFRERLARFGTGSIFSSKDTTPSTPTPAAASTPPSIIEQSGNFPLPPALPSPPLSVRDVYRKVEERKLLNSLEQMGMLERRSSLQSSIKSNVRVPDVESFRTNLAGLVVGECADDADSLFYDEDVSANSIDLSFSDESKESVSKMDSESKRSDALTAAEGSNDNQSVSRHEQSAIERKNTVASLQSRLSAIEKEQERQQEASGTGSVMMGTLSSIQIPPVPSVDRMDIDPPSLSEKTEGSVDKTMVGTSVTSGDVSVPMQLDEPATANTRPLSTPISIYNPDHPTLFTAEDIEPPKRRHIRWLKGDMIGKGSFGRVFYGVNLITREVMAVKQIDVIPISRYRNKIEAEKNRSKMIDSLRTEILLLNELNHGNIVRYLGFDIDNTLVSVFLEYVSGGSVASMIARFGRFEEELAQSLVSQVLNGLEYLHERSIIHRDIKGGNILVNMDGTAKISDFGISKKNELDMAYQLNAKMEFAGSVFWMAPEMSKNIGYSAKVDIWALGCVGLEMFTGTHPWGTKGPMQAIWELRQGHSPPIPSGLSQEALEFLGHCFQMDPNERPSASSMFELCKFVRVNPFDFDFLDWWEKKEEQNPSTESRDSSIGSDDDD
ncbi:hypothetical protein CcCBS67573_g01407 [Chytriomyces confervae]|uniref:Protein kinase domain-containing protein n=1 Tax=Chytriomyces confervae TaxID=246404 RepID=A0A507FP14_9FUNG|nr:hypothetical protein CcCBS67573_g01407 [Chytriomyces confervae]